MLSVQMRSTIRTVDCRLGNTGDFTPVHTYIDQGLFGVTTPAAAISLPSAVNDQAENLVIRVAALTASTNTGSRNTFAIDVLNFDTVTVTPPPSGTTLYSENFDAPTHAGKGLTLSESLGLVTGLAGVTTFGVTGDDSKTDSTANWARVKGQRFEWRDFGSLSVLTTSLVDITGMDTVDFSPDLGLLGAGSSAGGEYLTVEYLIDGVPTSVPSPSPASVTRSSP